VLYGNNCLYLDSDIRFVIGVEPPKNARSLIEVYDFHACLWQRVSWMFC